MENFQPNPPPMTTPTDKSEVSPPERNGWRNKRNKLVTNTPVLLSLLYDLNLLPEQVTDGSPDEFKLDTVVCHLTDLRAQVERLHADGAVMRGAMEAIMAPSPYSNPSAIIASLRNIASQALSTDAGRDLLARYREAVDLLSGVRLYQFPGYMLWQQRRDTLMAIVKGGSL